MRHRRFSEHLLLASAPGLGSILITGRPSAPSSTSAVAG
jgi:hypothetical protein